MQKNRADCVPILDFRYLHYLLTTHLHPATLLPPLLSTLRTTLFPNSSLPPPSSPPPSVAQQKALKRACARSLASLFPAPVLRRFFGVVGPNEADGAAAPPAAGTGDSNGGGWEEEEQELVLREIEKELEVWEDAYLNRHVAYAVVELVVVRLLPEMGEKGVQELMEARLGGRSGGE